MDIGTNQFQYPFPKLNTDMQNYKPSTTNITCTDPTVKTYPYPTVLVYEYKFQNHVSIQITKYILGGMLKKGILK